jgi:predicted RNase H-like nuclease (RuvC/YqgF family)
MDPESVGLGGVIATALAALALALNRVLGDPEKRMRHIERLGRIQGEASAAAVDHLADQVRQLSERLEATTTHSAELRAQNADLRQRVARLESEIRRALDTHVSDQATIAALTRELEMSRLWIAELEEKVADLDALVHMRTDTGAPDAAKKKATKRKRNEARE